MQLATVHPLLLDPPPSPLELHEQHGEQDGEHMNTRHPFSQQRADILQ